MSLSNDQNQDEVIQDRGLALGIDFGNSQISAAVWRPEKKTADMVKFGNKSSFPATLYFSELGEGRDAEINSLKPEIGVEYTKDKNMEYFVYDLKKYLGRKINAEKIKGETCYKISQDENGNLFC